MVGGGQGEVRQLRQGHPPNRLVLRGLWLSVRNHRNEIDDERGPRISERSRRGADGLDFQAQLLAQLPAGGLEMGLAWKELPPGEFPEAGMTLPLRPKGQEETAVALDDGGNDLDQRGAGWSLVVHRFGG